MKKSLLGFDPVLTAQEKNVLEVKPCVDRSRRGAFWRFNPVLTGREGECAGGLTLF
jgi:hypothetical protein